MNTRETTSPLISALESFIETFTPAMVPIPCDTCGEDATRVVGFLLDNYRRNPASSAYGRDDCSWCDDKRVYACEEHFKATERDVPDGMGWASSSSQNLKGTEWEHRVQRRYEPSRELIGMLVEKAKAALAAAEDFAN